MLHKRNDRLLGQRALRDALQRGELFVITRMNTADMKCPHYLFILTFTHLTFVHFFCANATKLGNTALGVASALIFAAITGSKPLVFSPAS